MDDRAKDLEAESELDKLELRLGLKQPAAPAVTPDLTQPVGVGTTPAAGETPTGGATASEAEKQLEELEKRLNANQ